MLMLPDDLATCALIGILWNYHRESHGYPLPPKPTRPEWVLTPAQEAVRDLAARIRSGR